MIVKDLLEGFHRCKCFRIRRSEGVAEVRETKGLLEGVLGSAGTEGLSSRSGIAPELVNRDGRGK